MTKLSRVFQLSIFLFAAVAGSGIAHADTIGSYRSFGFAVATPSGVFDIVREGKAAVDATGRIVSELRTSTGFVESSVVYDSEFDDRNPAGGVTPLGAIVVFLARFDSFRYRWIDMGFVRSMDNGNTWSQYQTVPVGDDTIFSPYGPLLTLPSGRLLQTVYGIAGSVHSIRVLSSDDDGESWKQLSTVVQSTDVNPTEAAAVMVGGSSNAKAKLLLIARTATPHGDNDGLRQFESSNGGVTWKARGRINISSYSGDVSPWLMRRPNGTVVLVWADRSSCVCLREVVVKPGTVWQHARLWPRSVDIYNSKLNAISNPDAGRFGYPSLLGDQVAFYDVDASDPGTGTERTAATTELLMQTLAF